MPKVQRKELFERARRATVMIARRKEGNEFDIVGSGFAVARKHFGSEVIVSAAHVLSPPSQELPTHIISVRMHRDQASGNWNQAPEISEIDPAGIVVHGSHDLAVTRTDIRFGTNRTLELAPQTRPFVGDEVATFGWPTTSHEGFKNGVFTPSALVGIISAIFPHPSLPRQTHAVYLAQLQTQAGSSGGPVFSMYSGRVIGVASARPLRMATMPRKKPKSQSTENDIPGEVRVGLARIAPITHVMSLKPPTPQGDAR